MSLFSPLPCKRKRLIFVLGILINLPLFSQKKISIFELDEINGLLYQRNTVAPFTGTATEEHSNGQKKMELPLKEGKPHGIAREWAKNGKKIYEVQYVNGLKSDLETQWYATGVKKAEMSFVNGLANGVFTEWYKNKNRKSTGQFKDGKEEGTHQWWYNTGELQQEATYKNGLEEGVVKNWFENGLLRLESAYLKGLQHGKTTEWFANGQKKFEGQYLDGKEHGEMYHWSKNGLPAGIEVYDHGTLVKDINYRSGAINFGQGYLQVFNEKESFFSIALTGNKVIPHNSVEIIYSIDGQYLQLLNNPVSDFITNTQDEIKEKDLLLKFMEYESDYIRKMTQFDIKVEYEFGQTAKGNTYLNWHFVSPSSKSQEQTPRTVKNEHYFSIICNKQVLSLYSVVTNSDDPVKIQNMLKRLSDAVNISEERIDLNQIVTKLKAAIPPVSSKNGRQN